LVSITAGCAAFEPYGSCIVGIIGGIVVVASSRFLKKCNIDDVCDAAPVHLFCGLWGVISCGFFKQSAWGAENTCGIFYSQIVTNVTATSRLCVDQGKFLGAQVVFAIVIVLWVGFTTGVMFYALNHFGMLRISKEIELQGMDTYEHGGSAYEHKTAASGSGTAVAAGDVESALGALDGAEFRRQFSSMLADPAAVAELKGILGSKTQ